MARGRQASAPGTLDRVNFTALRALLDLVLPTTCGGCDAPGPAWCPACRGTVGDPLELSLPAAPPILAVGRYAGPLRAALLGFKERNRRDLTDELAALLACAVPAIPRGRLWLVPAPSRPVAARARGGDHMLRLTRALAAQLSALGRPAVAAPALLLRRGGRDSVGLSPAARHANLAGRMQLRNARLPPPGTTVLLVDDVLTTGATVRVATATLRTAGVPVSTALVLCSATGSSPSGSSVQRSVAKP